MYESQLTYESPVVINPLSRAQYDRMVERGVFDDARVELVRGEVVAMSPQGPLHSELIKRLTRRLITVLGDRADVFVQAPLAVSDDSEPEPDICVVPSGDYSAMHPTSAHLAIEVSASSLINDRTVKASLYAEAQIPEYWIINLVERVVEVYTAPEGGRYRNLITRQPGAMISLVEFPDVAISVTELLTR